MSKGDWIVVMDCDLQDVPEEIPKLYEKAIQGYDAVLAQRIDRKDGIFKKIKMQCVLLPLQSVVECLISKKRSHKSITAALR